MKRKIIIAFSLIVVILFITSSMFIFKSLNNKSIKKTLNNEYYSYLPIEAKEYIQDGEFAVGSMLPKIEACIYFLNHTKNTKAIIASLANAKEAIHGKSGTTIVKGGE